MSFGLGGGAAGRHGEHCTAATLVHLMGLLTLANVSCPYGTQLVLYGVTVSIDPGWQAWLPRPPGPGQPRPRPSTPVARSGCGNATLRETMRGGLHADAGRAQVSRGVTVGYRRQEPDFDPQETVRDAAEGAFAKLHQLHMELDAVYHDMAEASGDQLDRMLKRQARLETEMETAGGYTAKEFDLVKGL